MKLPLQITFRNMDPSPAMETRIRALAERLEKFCDRITSCRIVVESSSHRQQQGALFRVGIDITVPGEEIATGQVQRLDHAHEDPYVALRDAFRAARRKLEDHGRKHRPRVKRATRRLRMKGAT